MKGYRAFSIVLVCLLLLSFSSCIFDPPGGERDDFYFCHHFYGGFAGISEKLEIFENKDVIFTSRSYNIKDKITEEEALELYGLIFDNDFFSLDSEYLHPFVYDDFYCKVSYVSDSLSYSVNASGTSMNQAIGTWAERLYRISSWAEELKDTLIKHVDMGRVHIRSIYQITDWPLSSEFNLTANANINVPAGEAVFNYLKQNKDDYAKTLYRENGAYFTLNSSGGFAFSYEDLDQFNVSVRQSDRITVWPFNEPLSSIGDSGMVVMGDDFGWIKNELSYGYYYTFFVQDTTHDVNQAYILSLIQGNNF